jgi:hypothetical protein
VNNPVWRNCCWLWNFGVGQQKELTEKKSWRDKLLEEVTILSISKIMLNKQPIWGISHRHYRPTRPSRGIKLKRLSIRKEIFRIGQATKKILLAKPSVLIGLGISCWWSFLSNKIWTNVPLEWFRFWNKFKDELLLSVAIRWISSLEFFNDYVEKNLLMV